MRRLGLLLLTLLCASAWADELYLRAFRSMRFPKTPEQAQTLQRAVTEGLPRKADALRALSLLNAEAIHALRRATSGEPRRFVYEENPGLNAALTPAELSIKLAHIALLEARCLAAAGRAIEAGELCADTAALGQDVMRGGPLAARLAGGRIHDLAADALGDLAPLIVEAERASGAAAGERIVDKLAALDKRAVPLADSVRAERDMLLAIFRPAAEAMRQNPAQGAAALEDRGAGGLADLVRDLLDQPVETWPLFEGFREIIGLADGPLHELCQSAAIYPTSDRLAQVIIGNARSALLGAEAGRTRLLAARVALAVAEARAAGRADRSLGILIEGVLDPVPPDPFTGFPFRLNQVEGGFFVYSHGPEGTDDRARIESSMGSERGDLVVWVPRRSRFVWRRLAPALEEWRNAGVFEWMKWDTHRPEMVFVATKDHIVVGDARRARLRKFPRSLLDPRPFEARAMAFGPRRAWLATSRGLFAFTPESARWKRWPVGSDEQADCLDARVEGEERLSVLVGPAETPSVLLLDAEARTWSRAAGEVARIWIHNVGLEER